MDLFFKVKSVMPTDDISDQIQDGQLLDLFRIEPTPMCLQSLHLSILSASMAPDIKNEMESIFKRELIATKVSASNFCQETRAKFDSVKDTPMIRNGKTFQEYLAYKKVQSWDKVGFDNALGEVSLCSHVWRINIALIWRHEGVWRLFVAPNGGASPIITLLFARTKVNLEGTDIFSQGSTNRFFPLIPTHDTWFDNEVFVPSTPDSIQVEQYPPIVLFEKKIHKEFAFQSELHHEGSVSSDEESEVTADASQSALFDSFVDNTSVSQGSLPTPPDIKEIPLPAKVQAINKAMSLPLAAIRRRRIVESDDEERCDKAGTANDGSAKGSE
jgi:hypothetical protein